MRAPAYSYFSQFFLVCSRIIQDLYTQFTNHIKQKYSKKKLGNIMSNALKKAKQLTALRERVEKAKSLIIRKEKTEHPEKILAHNEMPDTLYKSKLMLCVEVLCTLVAKGPMKMIQLINNFEMEESRLEPHLRLLWNRGLIEEEEFDNETLYIVTERGITVLKVVSPLIREAHKLQMRNFEAISNVLSGAGYS